MKRALSIVLGVSGFMMAMALFFAFVFYVDWAYQSGVQLSLEAEQKIHQPSNLAASVASAKDIESIKPSCLHLAKYADAYSNLSKYQSEQSNRLYHGGLIFFMIIFILCASMLLFAYLTLRKALKTCGS
jgi:hypothetical protein